MKITIDINTENAAFEDNPSEIKEIINKVAKQVNAGCNEDNLRDSNGNTVGKFKVTGK
jgi:hypothetical protein